MDCPGNQQEVVEVDPEAEAAGFRHHLHHR